MQNMENVKPKAVWKYALIPVIAMAILALYPQLSLWISKAPDWQGAYFVSNYDEVAYSAYINALINGKPRRNDPFTGSDDPARESLYSIQFVPAYSIAAPARLLGISASSAFIFLSLFIAVSSSLALFWLINSVTGNSPLAAIGTLTILCFGTAAAFQGELRYWIEGRVLIDFFPFLRRYQPGFAFPLFFVFCGLVWRSFTETAWKRVLAYAVAGGITFAALVFSYFYLWTAAAAWFGCLAVVNVIGGKENRSRIISSIGIIGVFAITSLIPYYVMLSNRTPNLDSIQLLTNTHSPEFVSPSLMFGLCIAIAIGALIFKGRAGFNEPKTMFAISFAITPVMLFNQQIFTGRSLQPVHYEIFIANYLVLTAALLLVAILLKPTDSGERSQFPKGLAYLAALAIVWGIIEAAGSTGRGSVFADIRDQSIPAIRLIEQNEAAAKPSSERKPVVLATNFITSDFIPSISLLRPLWNPHTSSAGGVSVEENKRLFHLYLYYSGFTGREMEEALKQNVFEVTAAIFGSERALPALGQTGSRISADEIRTEVKKYDSFSSLFNAGVAANPALDYIIVPEKAEPNYNNIDRWYSRDEGKTAGLFKVYKLTPKTAARPSE